MNLCEIVNQSAGNLAFSINGNFLRNDIAPDIRANTCKKSLEEVIDGLINYAASHAAGKPIRIFAKKYNDIILVQVKYSDSHQETAAGSILQKIKPVAEALGGCLYISHSSISETTLSFTYLNRGARLTA